jgi:hypothetical protein
MKIGRGFYGPMLKIYRKPAAKVCSFFLRTAALAVAALSLTLSGCGELSLNELIENQEPGELKVSPRSATVVIGTVLTLQGTGGFKPYTYAKGSGTGDGDLETKTGKLTATGAGSLIIEVTDYAGKKAQGTVEIVDQLKILYSGQPVEQLTFALPDTPPLELDFAESGGVGPYVYSVEGPGASIDPGTGEFSTSVEGDFVVDVSDSLGNSAVATVKVLDVGGPLTVSPEVTYVRYGQTVDFTAFNYDPATYSFSVQTPGVGSIDPTANPDVYRYTPPASGEDTQVTIILSDILAEVTATVHILNADPDPLTISPASFGEDLVYGESVVFIASGGLFPYTFWLEYDGAHGTLEQINDNQARYTAPNANTVDWVWVSDALNNIERVKTKVGAD